MGAGDYDLNQFEFDPERDLKSYPVWFGDLMHGPRPWRPLAQWAWAEGIAWGMQYGPETMSIPQTKGWDFRLVNGLLYCAVIEATPEEIPEREKVFREKVTPMIEDFDGEWRKAKEKWLAVVDYFKERCHPERIKQLSNAELLDILEDYQVRILRGMWTVHWCWMYPIFQLYSMFAELCEQLTGIGIEHPTFKKLLGGFDNEQFRLSRRLWQLGAEAKELGLAELFLTTEDNEELLSKLEQSEAGRKWLPAYREFVEEYGWMVAQIPITLGPTWLQKPSLYLRDVKIAMAKGGDYTPDAERERLVKEREEAEREILAKVPSEQREWFEALMRIGQRSSYFSEEHGIFLDMNQCSIGVHIFTEFGRRFAEAGVIDDQEDIYFLFPQEVRKAAIAMERCNLRPYVEKRRKQWEANMAIEPVPFIGDVAALGALLWKDSMIRITSAPPTVKPELKADLYGASSVPGVVEGIARVIMAESEIDQVQPGEILVTPTTSVPWTPVFGIISAVITDFGGSLAHAAIMAREYKIPAVVGTLEGSRKIKTGDRIRVDGDLGGVFILNK